VPVPENRAGFPIYPAMAGKPPRLSTIDFENFRAFAGPNKTTIRLDAKNLLIYGENGAGKSSIFHGLNGLFSLEGTAFSRSNLISSQKNCFSDVPDEDVLVGVSFDDGYSYGWGSDWHPANSRDIETIIVKAAYRKAMLDYRSLLDTNYRYADGELNLFEAIVQTILRDWPISHGGSEEPLIDLWQRIRLFWYADRHDQNTKYLLRTNIESFNPGLQQALDAVLPKANLLLESLGWGDVKVEGLRFPRLSINWHEEVRSKRELSGRIITPQLTFRGKEIEHPHRFLNEARLSGLAIALYLAGRQICAETTFQDTPKLMVLDDVLIGLDQSNRLPVLRLLTTEFANWQIILLTHDRVWFEMARTHLPDSGDQEWTSLELFEGTEPSGITRPIQRPKNMDVIADNLAQAASFLADHHDNAAAVHTRMAFEHSLKKFCEKRGVPVAFKSNPKDLNTEHLLNAIDNWLADPARAAKLAVLDPLLKNARTCRSVILNPYSHSTPVTLVAAEIQSAIDAVSALDVELKRQ
jgi:energy-coupling factor transporter ATP-binding protein EcfA2